MDNSLRRMQGFSLMNLLQKDYFTTKRTEFAENKESGTS